MQHDLTTWLVGLIASSGVVLVAHHPVTTIYDEQQTLTVEGTVGRIVFQRPHPLLHLEVTSRGGGHRTWAVEFDRTEQLGGPSVEGTVVRPGDEVAVCGNPGRDPGQYRLRMLSLQRSDGLSLRSPVSVATQCER